MLALLNAEHLEGVSYINIDNNVSTRELQRRLISHALEFFPDAHDVLHNPCDILKKFATFRILSPMRKGPLGIEELNGRFLQAAKVRSHDSPHLVVPIIIVRNHYRLQLFNGEMGVLVKFKENSNRDYAIFSSPLQGTVRTVSAALLPSFEYAYCISIHKSQGSEFDHTLLLLPEGSQSFGCEALYTGMTRARRHLEIWSHWDILRQMANHRTHRHSGIA